MKRYPEKSFSLNFGYPFASRGCLQFRLGNVLPKVRLYFSWYLLTTTANVNKPNRFCYRKITGKFPSTSLLGYGCMNCGEISGVRSDVYMCSCPAPQIIIAPHPSALKRGTSHIHHDSHIGVCFSSSFRTMFWILLCPLLNEKSLK